MSDKYILGIDQSTSGTKALLFDGAGDLILRRDLSHKQIVNDLGWVEHDLDEIYRNTLEVARLAITGAGIDKSLVAGVGISNQRETAAVWNRETGKPVYNAIVWQCARGEAICQRLSAAGHAEKVKAVTGLNLSPYFSAAKIAWVLENADAGGKNLCAGTIDSWLNFKLAGSFKTDYSNASRTQLFDLVALRWSEEVCGLFGIDTAILPEVCDSDSCFGYTDLGGFLDVKIPIHGVMGDSHAALYGQGCHRPGMMKSTYGTGSSVVMNTGKAPVFSDKGVVTSIAWGKGGAVDYILEGNINYTGAVMKWVVEDLGLIESPKLAGEYAAKANQEDETYLVPAFSGLGAPYWNSKARALLCGMTRTTGKAEIVKAAEECVAYQIADIVAAMAESAHIKADSFRADGGPTRDKYLMQFQSDILNLRVLVPAREELSGIGAALMAGIALHVYDGETVFSRMERTQFTPRMDAARREKKLAGWHEAIHML